MKVLIIYKFMPHWRIDFFNALRKKLKRNNIDLDIFYGKVSNNKNDQVKLKWGKFYTNLKIGFGKYYILWQPVFFKSVKYDLIIVEQANKLIINFIFLFFKRFYKYKIAFWGHGYNLMTSNDSFGNRIKKMTMNHCDWWFAYSNSVKKILIKNGVKKSKISVVNNTLDIDKMSYQYDSFELSDNYKKLLNIDYSSNVAIFCGSIYKEKGIDFLLETAKLVKDKVTDFQLIIIGKGPYLENLLDFASKNKWIHYVGNKFDKEKIPYFKISKILVIPDAVGLVAIDSFAYKTPIITTEGKFHGPEFDYLINGVNSIITKKDIHEYALNIIDILENDKKLQKLISGCVNSRNKYTLDGMISKYNNGVLRCLNI